MRDFRDHHVLTLLASPRKRRHWGGGPSFFVRRRFADMPPAPLTETAAAQPPPHPDESLDSLLRRGYLQLPVIQNVVSTVKLQVSLDLVEIARKLKNTEYNPRRFKAVIVRERSPKATGLIFHTGSLVCTGAKSVEDSNTAAKMFAKAVQTAIGSAVKFQGFQVQNVVGSGNVRFPVRLEGLHMAHKGEADYEPELFPGLIYKMMRPKVVLLVFVSGRVVFTGAKSKEDIYEAFRKIYPMLMDFRKPDAAM